MIRSIIFDFDGVILESVEVKDRAIYNLFENTTDNERQKILELHRKNPGINRRERVELLLKEGLAWEADPELVDSLLERFKNLVMDGLIASPEVPGVRNFLEQLSEIPCYIASAAPQEELNYVANQRDFTKYFVEMLGWPPAKTELLGNIVQKINLSPDSVLFIGDKISDHEAACYVGTNFLGRKTPQNPTVFPENVKVIEDFYVDMSFIHI